MSNAYSNKTKYLLSYQEKTSLPYSAVGLHEQALRCRENRNRFLPEYLYIQYYLWPTKAITISALICVKDQAKREEGGSHFIFYPSHQIEEGGILFYWAPREIGEGRQ